jgi:hypothetical protein
VQGYRSRMAQSNLSALLSGSILLGLLGLLGCGPSADELAALSTDLGAAMERARAADLARAAGIEADLAAPTVTATRCLPAVVLMRTGSAPSTPVGYLVRLEEGNYREVARAELATPGTRLRWAEDRAATVSGALAPDAHYPIDSQEALSFRRSQAEDIGDPARPAGYRYDVELVILEQVAPRVVGDSFLPGRLRARIVVWDYAEGRVACHADASVASLDTERVTEGATERSLMINLTVRLRGAALEAVGL